MVSPGRHHGSARLQAPAFPPLALALPCSWAIHKGMDAPLAPYRCLDLTDWRGWLCGKLLADLGMDVIKLEPPSGDPGRWWGPFLHDHSDAENGLPFWFQNRGKRSITLNLETPDGQALLLELVARADCLVESFEPGYLAGLGLDAARLEQANPALVHTSITAFGSKGPYAGLPATDLTLQALCGHMYLTGEPDQPPVRVSVPQAFPHAAAEAALDTVIALYHAKRTGTGQHVDVSAQLVQMRSMMNAAQFPPLEHRDITRQGNSFELGEFRLKVVYRCSNGFITIMPFSSATDSANLVALRDWAHEELGTPPHLEGAPVDQLNLFSLLFEPDKQALIVALCQHLAGLFLRHTKEELYEGAIARSILLAPINTMADIMQDRQLQAREYFVTVDHGSLGPVTYPGPWARLSATPLANTPRAPHIGEHSAAVYGELLGLSAQRQLLLQQLHVI